MRHTKDDKILSKDDKVLFLICKKCGKTKKGQKWILLNDEKWINIQAQLQLRGQVAKFQTTSCPDCE